MPERVSMFRFIKGETIKTFDGPTLQDAYHKAVLVMGKPDHFVFEYYAVPMEVYERYA
jgi:hypothetical protein